MGCNAACYDHLSRVENNQVHSNTLQHLRNKKSTWHSGTGILIRILCSIMHVMEKANDILLASRYGAFQFEMGPNRHITCTRKDQSIQILTR